MTKKEWENCNTCWTCAYRIVMHNKVVTHQPAKIFCGYGGEIKTLTSKEIINSPDCPVRTSGCTKET